MAEIDSGSGVVLGFGGTNARIAIAEHGDIRGFSSIMTPETPREFFGWMSRHVLDAANDGHGWLVAGLPGPVDPEGSLVGPMANVPGLADRRYDLREELSAADPATSRLMDEGFSVVAVNDGELAAQAAATMTDDPYCSYGKVAALILGTGVGAGVVVKDEAFPGVFRSDKTNPLEIGHVLLSDDPIDTFENLVSGPALERAYGTDARELAADHPAWKRVGVTVGKLSIMLGLMNGVEFIVPCGGVGAGAADKYWPYMTNLIKTTKLYGNKAQRLFVPNIMAPRPEEAQTFEMFGGEAVMRDFLTRFQTSPAS